MIITAKDLKEKVKTIFPKLKYFWIWQEFFYAPSLDELNNIIKTTTIEQMPYIDNKIDCDIFALLLHAEIIKLGIQNNKTRMAFGQVFVDKHRNINELHKLNVCLTQEGLYFVEPQTDHIWLANKKEDNPLFMEFI